MHDSHDDRIFERACKGLAKAGIPVELIVTHPKDEEIEGVSIKALNARSGWQRRIFSSREAWQKAMNSDADIFHFHDPDLLPWMTRLSKAGKRVVYDVHENYSSRIHKLPLPGFIKNVLAKWYRSYEKNCMRKFHGVVVVSESMKALFTDAHQDIEIIQNVPDLEVLGALNINGAHLAQQIIYTSGTNSDARNCRQTVSALKSVVDEYPEVVMEFVGRYVPAEYPSTLESIAKDTGALSALKIEGMLPWLDNFKRTSKAYMGCVFYQDNPNNRVGIPNRLFEYMYCGIPVLAEDFPELRSIVEETQCGILVSSDKPHSIAAAAKKLLGDPDLAKQMGLNGRKAVMEKYNFNT